MFVCAVTAEHLVPDFDSMVLVRVTAKHTDLTRAKEAEILEGGLLF